MKQLLLIILLVQVLPLFSRLSAYCVVQSQCETDRQSYSTITNRKVMSSLSLGRRNKRQIVLQVRGGSSTAVGAKTDAEKASPIPSLVVQRKAKRSAALGVFLPWLYFMSICFNTATLPRYVNWSINGGDESVSPASAAVYGTLSGLDSFFTFFTVNLVGCCPTSLAQEDRL